MRRKSLEDLRLEDLKKQIKSYQRSEENQLAIFALLDLLKSNIKENTVLAEQVYARAKQALEEGSAFYGSFSHIKDHYEKRFLKIQNEFYEDHSEKIDAVLNSFYRSTSWSHIHLFGSYDLFVNTRETKPKLLLGILTDEKIDRKKRIKMMDHFLFKEFSLAELPSKLGLLAGVDESLKAEYQKQYQGTHDELLKSILYDLDHENGYATRSREYQLLMLLEESGLYSMQHLLFQDQLTTGEFEGELLTTSFASHAMKASYGNLWKVLYQKDNYEELPEEVKEANTLLMLDNADEMELIEIATSKHFYLSNQTAKMLAMLTNMAWKMDRSMIYQRIVEELPRQASSKKDYKNRLVYVKKYTELLGVTDSLEEARKKVTDTLLLLKNQIEETKDSLPIAAYQYQKKEN